VAALLDEGAILRTEDGRWVIESALPTSLLALLATLEPLDEDLPAIADPPAEPFEF
jgi:antitoxin VapB